VSEAHRSLLRFSALAGVLAVGAPGGWLALRLLRAGLTAEALARELSENAELYLYLLLSTSLSFVAFGAILGVLVDRLLASNRRFQEQSITDALTGLRNPRYFRERLEEECRRADRDGTTLGLVMIDLDHFKLVNDRYGHAFGDLTLAHAAKTIARCARASDVVCRIGGEEFALICPRTQLDEAVVVAERIRAALAQTPFSAQSKVAPLTASIGVSVRAPGASPEDALAAADKGLYISKGRGRNRVEAMQSGAVQSSSA
jgi:diguanylate cyclase (GGDEF)-like protein